MSSKKHIIVFIHQGNSGYLKTALRQARSTNLDTDIFLLGDDNHREICKEENIRYENFFSYYDTEKLKQFSFSYKHLSTNDGAYEFFCFARWFILESFIVQNQVESFFIADSDVLLYADIKKEFTKFKNFKFTLTNNASAGISFFNDISSLSEFTEFCVDVYNGSHKFIFDRCQSHYMDLQKNNQPGGVCDMTLWSWFRTDRFINPGLVGETSEIIEDSTYDHNINQSDGYEMLNGRKNIKMINNIPYCKNLWMNKDVKMNCLHFQGNAKILMEKYVTYER